MKKISKLVGLTLAALAIMLTGCRKSTGSSTPIDRDEIPADAVRLYGEGSKLTELSVYGVEDLEKLAELVNAGDDFDGMTVTVRKDIVINKNLLTENFIEPEEGEDATPNPNLKNLNSIGTSVSPESKDTLPFKGTFDGNGKIISGLYMYQGHQGLGFIGVADGATVKNVILIDSCVINKNTWTGGLKTNSAGEEVIDHDGKDDDRFGGLIGITTGSAVTIENCLFAGVLGSQAALDRGSPYEYIGGLVGRCDTASSAKDSFAFARIYGHRDDKTEVVCDKNGTKLSRTNVNGDGKGVEVTEYTDEIKNQILEAVAAVKANVQ